MTVIASFIKHRTIQALFLIYFLSLPYWLWIYFTNQEETINNYYWTVITSGILPLFGGLAGIWLARKWGFLSSALGRAIIFFSAGEVVYGVASLIWSGYNFGLFGAAVDAPYPSLADAIYILMYPAWLIGLISLGAGIGAGYKLKTLGGKITLVLAPVIGAALTYFFFIFVAQGGEFVFDLSDFAKTFFDVFYLLGDAIIITGVGLIYGLSYNVFGGRFRWQINILFVGLLVTYAADAAFAYATSQDTYFTSDWVDLLFVTSSFLITVSVNALDIQGITSRARQEIVMFAPRATEAVNQLILEIIQRQAHIIGPVAWDEAMKVSGLSVDMKNNNLSIEGNPKDVLENLVMRYRDLFGDASLEICRSAARKFIVQVPQEQRPAILT